MKRLQGDKHLVGNAGYRRFLATPRGHFEIDAKRVAEDARFMETRSLLTRETIHPPLARSSARWAASSEWWPA
jgi:hypothetical protein